jgi:phosphatidylglycerol:prolipoprotein diacylglycerol transferase
MSVAVITIGIDPTIELGPVTVAWHGLTIALGILIGGVAAASEARRRRLDVDPLYTIGAILTVSALVGSRVYYLAERGRLLDPAEWLGTNGFTFYGGFIAAALAIAAYLAWRRLSVRYLDTVAVGLPLGIAVGRIGDVINGEHYGPATTFFLGVRNTHPEADVPSPDVAYHSGGLYEVLIAAAVFAVVWPLRRRLRRPTEAVWLVIGLLALGRFFGFFVRSDSETLAFGLETAQLTSLALVAVAGLGLLLTRWRFADNPPGLQARTRRPKGSAAARRRS